MQILVTLCCLSAASALILPETKFAEEATQNSVDIQEKAQGSDNDGSCLYLQQQALELIKTNVRNSPSGRAKECERADEDLYIPRMGKLGFSLVKEMKGMGRNAALSELPIKMKQKLGKGAEYIYIPTLSHNQCEKTCSGDHGTKWRTDDDNGIMDRDYAVAVFILNKQLDPILGPVTKFGAEDMRVLKVGQNLFVDYHYKGANWEMRQLDLEVGMCNDLMTTYKAVTWGNYDALEPGYEGQNIQLVPHQNSLYSIWWENQTAVTEIRKINEDGSNNVVNFARKFKKEEETQEITVSGSVHPLFLPEVGAYLGAAHYSRKQGEHGYDFGSEYVQFLTLHDADPPFNLMKRTKDFCFGSVDAKNLWDSKNNECEILQHVSSIIRADDPNYLLLSVSIHDCRSLLLKVPVKTVLEQMESPEATDATPRLNFARMAAK